MGELAPTAPAGLADRLGTVTLGDGRWFEGLLARRLALHAAHRPAEAGVSVEERAAREVRKVALKTAATGAIAAALATTGELATFFTEGIAGPVGVPAAVLSILMEATYKALLQIDLVCDLGVLYDAPFGPEQADEVTALFAAALLPRNGAPRAMAEELALLSNGALAARVGRRLLQGSFMRNALPVVGLAVSAGVSLAGTRKLGATTQGHLKVRRALAGPVGRLRAADPTLVVESVWRVATANGRPGLLAAAAVLHLLGRSRVGVAATAGDEEAWLARLAGVDAELQPALLDALHLVAGAEGPAAPAKTRVLKLVGETFSAAARA